MTERMKQQPSQDGFTPSQSEIVLMQRIARGDDQAFKCIVDQHSTMIFDLCYRYLGHRQDAEEVSQDVFIRLYKMAPKWQPRAKLSTFLYRIAVNLSLNRIRDNKRRRWLSLDTLGEKDSCVFTASEAQRPDYQLEVKERAARVYKAISRLPEKQRTAIILRRYHEKSYLEIAEIMSCSVQSVESRLFRARQRLKVILSDL